MKKLLALLLILFPTVAFSANHYVRAGAGGSANGSDWTNAWSDIPATLTRGDTYYVAGGNYDTTITFDDNLSGELVITIKKATVADHGTETGWDNSYATAVARWKKFYFTRGYYTIDGVTGGGSAAWETGHGFEFYNASPVAWNDIPFQFEDGVGHITVSHSDIHHTSSEMGGNLELVYANCATTGCDNITFSYNFIHDSPCNMFSGFKWSNFTFEHNKMARNFSDAAGCHGDGFEVQSGGTNHIHRWNWFEDVEGTYLWGKHGDSATLAGIEIYGNLVSWTDNATYGGFTNGLFATITSGTGAITGGKFYNNTVVRMPAGGVSGIAVERPGSDIVANNNLWFGNAANPGFSAYVTHDYNANSSSLSEANDVTVTSSVFANYASGDYSLVAGSNIIDAGTSLGTPYNEDILGNTRSGTWDIGAYEYISVTPNPPSIRLHIFRQ